MTLQVQLQLRHRVGHLPCRPSGTALGDRRAAAPASFVVSAIFHYLGPSFAVLLFAHVDVLGVAWLRIASAARCSRCGAGRGAPGARRARRRLLLVALGVRAGGHEHHVLPGHRAAAAGTVGAIEFLGVILAALGARTRRNVARSCSRSPASRC